MIPLMSEYDMKISRLIDILQMVQKKHGDIKVSKDEKHQFEGIQLKVFVNAESDQFEEPELII